MKKIVLITILIISFILISCNKQVVDTRYETNDNYDSNSNYRMEQSFKEMEIPNYLYFHMINGEDIYLDLDGNIFIQKEEKKKILATIHISYGTDDLSELQEFIDYFKKYEDKEGNLYIYDSNAYSEKSLYRIDNSFNVEYISNRITTPLIFDGVFYYVNVDPWQVVKYENNQKQIIMEEEGYQYEIEINQDNLLLITKKRVYDYKWYFDYYIYKDYSLTKTDNPKQKEDEYKTEKRINKKTINIEKIENYKSPNLDNNYVNEDIDLENKKSDDKSDELIKSDYLYFYDDGSVSYYFNGKQVTGTLVFVEGNMETNKGPICFSDTYAYYFGPGGKAMPSGKISPYDSQRFETDSSYRILKSCTHVYDILTKNKNKYELYNNYFLMGKYEQDDIQENGKEDIKWMVLEDNGSEVLLLSRYILDYMTYDEKYLNNAFYNTAFTEEEKSKIVTKNGKDKLFLINAEILKKHYEGHYKNDKSAFLSAIPTNYVINKGIELHKEDDINYYHADYQIDNFKYVDSEGKILNIDNMDQKHGVRPAMWVKKE